MKLQQVQIGQSRGEAWEIRMPNQDVIATLPKTLSDGEVINVVEFAQTHEKAAFDEGVQVGQGSMKAAHSARIDAMLDRIRSLEAHNAMLAEKLENLLDGDRGDAND